MSDRAAHWQRLLREWEHSGLSQAEFCRRQRVNAVTFAWWKRRLRQSEDQADGPRAGRARRSGFVEVTLPRDTAVPAIRGARLSPVERYELVLPGGVGLRLPGDFDPELVARFVGAIAALGLDERRTSAGTWASC